MPPSAHRPRGVPPEALAFASLVACADLMAAGYLLDLAGLSMSPLALAIVFVAAFAVSVFLFARASSGSVKTAHFAGFIGVMVLSAGYLLWLASPSFLPVTIGPDLVHHLQLIHLIQRTHRLAHDPALTPYLLEMMNYTPGSHILAATLADWLRIDAVRVVQPITAVLTGLKMGLLYLIAARVSESSRASAIAPLAAPVLAFAPAVYTIGSSFHFFYYAQIVSEAFAIGMLLAVLCWQQTGRRAYLLAFGACGVGAFLSWPVWLGPCVGVLIVFLLLGQLDWKERAIAASIALVPVALVGVVHSLIHAEGGRILTSSGAVTAPSVEAFGLGFLVVAVTGILIGAFRLRAGLPVVVFLAVALAQSLVLALLARRAGAASLYLPFKMMYLVVFPGAILGALALTWFADTVRVRIPRLRAVAAVVPVIVAVLIVAGRVPRGPQKSPVNEPSYAVGLWARDNVPRACVDYFSTHWLTGYWLHLDVFGNPRNSDRMRAESFEFRDSVGKWLEGRGLPYGFVENLADIPREVRPDMIPIHTVGSATLVRNGRPSAAGCAR